MHHKKAISSDYVCDGCNGEGQISVPTFHGSGTSAKRTCKRCNGSGIDPESSVRRQGQGDGMTLNQLRHELNKLPLEAEEWPVQILFWNADQAIYDNEDAAHVSADEAVVIIVGKSAE